MRRSQGLPRRLRADEQRTTQGTLERIETQRKGERSPSAESPGLVPDVEARLQSSSRRLPRARVAGGHAPAAAEGLERHWSTLRRPALLPLVLHLLRPSLGAPTGKEGVSASRSHAPELTPSRSSPPPPPPSPATLRSGRGLGRGSRSRRGDLRASLLLLPTYSELICFPTSHPLVRSPLQSKRSLTVASRRSPPNPLPSLCPSVHSVFTPPPPNPRPPPRSLRALRPLRSISSPNTSSPSCSTFFLPNSTPVRTFTYIARIPLAPAHS